MVEAELWLPRAQRRRFHQPRLRRERIGELVQIDGSEHRWFEDRGPPCTLLVFVDDATSRIMQARFVPSETTLAHFEALEGYLKAHGRPVAFYSDKHTVFRLPKPGRHGSEMTQFGRALAELQVEIGVRQLEPSEGPRGARQPHTAGSAREGDALGGHLGHRRGERVPARLRGAPQRALREGPRPA